MAKPVKVKGLKQYTVRIEYRLEKDADISSNWNRETYIVIAPTADKAIEEATRISKGQESDDFGPTIHRLAEVIEGDDVDGVVLN